MDVAHLPTIDKRLTFDGCAKLGEFRRISVGASSDRGRGSFVGVYEGPFEMRNGGTCSSQYHTTLR
jgi:hypothetical protein